MNRGERTFFVYLGICFLLILFPFLSSAEPNTYLEIPNSPPQLERMIPNQSWPMGTNLTNAFDLDDYFYDAETNLNYTFSPVLDVNITIDSEGIVSFYPNPLFGGTRTVIFNASDGELFALSNLVYLEIGNDIFSPQWFNPRIDKIKVYPNTFVGFSVDWTDNFELYNYSFEVNQEETWTTYSGFLNGSSDTATHSVQITSSPGKIVEWRGCAWDPAGNSNCTEIKQFDVLVTPENPPVSGDEGDDETNYDYTRPPSGTIGEYVETIFKSEPQSDFSLSANYFSVSLKQGESKTRVVEISNTGDNPLNFTLYVREISEFVELSEEYIELFPGETKSVTIDFKTELNTELGEYRGVLIIDSFKEARIPISLTVNDVDLIFEVLVTILNDQQTVKPGKNVRARLDINNLRDQILTGAILQYSVKDFNGNIYNSGEENISFDYSLSLEKELEIPEESPLGPYIFYARVFNEKASALNSAAFNVGAKFEFAYYLKVSIIFFFIVLFSFIILLLLLRYRKQVDKGKALNLYIRLNEMRTLINEENFEEAADLYIRIKKIYGQKVSEEVINDKTKLTEEIKKLSNQIDLNAVKNGKEKAEGEEKEGEEKKEDSLEENSKEEKEEKEESEVDEEKEEKTEEQKEEPKKLEDEKKIEGSEKKPLGNKVVPAKTAPAQKAEIPVKKNFVPKTPVTEKKTLEIKPSIKQARPLVTKPGLVKKMVPVKTIPVEKKEIQKTGVKSEVTPSRPVTKKEIVSGTQKNPNPVPAKKIVQEKKVVPKKINPSLQDKKEEVKK